MCIQLNYFTDLLQPSKIQHCNLLGKFSTFSSQKETRNSHLSLALLEIQVCPSSFFSSHKTNKTQIKQTQIQTKNPQNARIGSPLLNFFLYLFFFPKLLFFKLLGSLILKNRKCSNTQCERTKAHRMLCSVPSWKDQYYPRKVNFYGYFFSVHFFFFFFGYNTILKNE